MKILHHVDTLNKRDGGPTRCIVGLAESQIQLGHEVTIVCEQTDIENNVEHLRIYNLGSNYTRSNLKKLLSDFNILHVHGIWKYSNHAMIKAAQATGVPYIISPHGMLQQWAVNQKKIKKKLAWWLYQKSDLIRAKKIIATADLEVADINRLVPNKKIFTLYNGIEYQGEKKSLISAGVKRALFISRIHEKKGICDLIPVWCELKPNNWELIVVGPDSNKLWVDLSERYPITDNNIKYLGELDGVEKANIYKSADVMVLPTYSENFGLVIAESLSIGTPVLTTTGTPWSMLGTLNCGWYIEPGAVALKDQLGRIFSMTKSELFEMGTIGVEYIKREFSWREIALKSIELYSE